jgi:PIN domain nuclease of toxin-antitoxin system
MKYLLDTHTYYWFRQSPAQIPSKAFDLLTDASTEALLSLVTPWELAIKVGFGKLDAMELLIEFENRESAAGFAMIPVTTAQVIHSGLLPSHHRDPFDRLLIAQAFDLRVPIVSNDRTFDLYGVQRIWD